MAYADDKRSVSSFLGILINRAWIDYLEELAEATTLAADSLDSPTEETSCTSN